MWGLIGLAAHLARLPSGDNPTEARNVNPTASGEIYRLTCHMSAMGVLRSGGARPRSGSSAQGLAHITVAPAVYRAESSMADVPTKTLFGAIPAASSRLEKFAP